MRRNSTNWLLIVAVIVFVVGVIALLALYLTPTLADGSTAPTIVYILTMCAPAGFLLGVVAALRAGRRVR